MYAEPQNNESVTACSLAAIQTQFLTSPPIANKEKPNLPKRKKWHITRDTDYIKRSSTECAGQWIHPFGQKVGVLLNKLPLKKALEMQMVIQAMFSECRLNELNNSSLSMTTSTLGTSTNGVNNENTVSFPYGLHCTEQTDNMSVHELSIDSFNDDMQELFDEEVVTTHFIS